MWAPAAASVSLAGPGGLAAEAALKPGACPHARPVTGSCAPSSAPAHAPLAIPPGPGAPSRGAERRSERLCARPTPALTARASQKQWFLLTGNGVFKARTPGLSSHSAIGTNT